MGCHGALGEALCGEQDGLGAPAVLSSCPRAGAAAPPAVPGELVASKEPPGVGGITLSALGTVAPGSEGAFSGLQGLSTCSVPQFLCVLLRTATERLLKIAGGAASKAKRVLGQRKKLGMFSELASGNLLSWSSCCYCAAGSSWKTRGEQPQGSVTFHLVPWVLLAVVSAGAEPWWSYSSAGSVPIPVWFFLLFFFF